MIEKRDGRRGAPREWKEPTPGVCWKEPEGKLYCFSLARVIVVRASDPAAWIRTATTDYFRSTLYPPPPFSLDASKAAIREAKPHCRAGQLFDWDTGPGFAVQLELPFPTKKAHKAELRAKAWASFFDAIDRDVGGFDPLEVARRFDERQWACLVGGLKAGVGGLELATTNPALFFAAAASARALGLRRSWHWRWFRSALRRPRRDLVRSLGLVPPAGSGFGLAWAVRVLQAIPARTVTVQRLLYLKQAVVAEGEVWDRARKALAHLAGGGQRLNAGVLRVVTDAGPAAPAGLERLGISSRGGHNGPCPRTEGRGASWCW